MGTIQRPKRRYMLHLPDYPVLCLMHAKGGRGFTRFLTKLTCVHDIQVFGLNVLAHMVLLLKGLEAGSTLPQQNLVLVHHPPRHGRNSFLIVV